MRIARVGPAHASLLAILHLAPTTGAHQQKPQQQNGAGRKHEAAPQQEIQRRAGAGRHAELARVLVDLALDYLRDGGQRDGADQAQEPADAHRHQGAQQHELLRALQAVLEGDGHDGSDEAEPEGGGGQREEDGHDGERARDEVEGVLDVVDQAEVAELELEGAESQVVVELLAQVGLGEGELGRALLHVGLGVLVVEGGLVVAVAQRADVDRVVLLDADGLGHAAERLVDHVRAELHRLVGHAGARVARALDQVADVALDIAFLVLRRAGAAGLRGIGVLDALRAVTAAAKDAADAVADGVDGVAGCVAGRVGRVVDPVGDGVGRVVDGVASLVAAVFRGRRDIGGLNEVLTERRRVELGEC